MEVVTHERHLLVEVMIAHALVPVRCLAGHVMIPGCSAAATPLLHVLTPIVRIEFAAGATSLLQQLLCLQLVLVLIQHIIFHIFKL